MCMVCFDTKMKRNEVLACCECTYEYVVRAFVKCKVKRCYGASENAFIVVFGERTKKPLHYSHQHLFRGAFWREVHACEAGSVIYQYGMRCALCEFDFQDFSYNAISCVLARYL
jgi:hypothetical protein